MKNLSPTATALAATTALVLALTPIALLSPTAANASRPAPVVKCWTSTVKTITIHHGHKHVRVTTTQNCPAVRQPSTPTPARDGSWTVVR